MRRFASPPIALALALAACASAPPGGVKVVDDPAPLNRDCKLLGTVNGRSLLGGMSEDARADAARNDALAKAAAMGATHVYYLKVDTGGVLNTVNVTARAYVCK